MNKLFTLQVFLQSSFSAENEIGFRTKPSLHTVLSFLYSLPEMRENTSLSPLRLLWLFYG